VGKLKITSGKWKVSDCIEYQVSVVSPWSSLVKPGCISPFGDYRGAQICIAEYNCGVPTKKQAIANARFIAEAGTVANETGLMPRKMKNQRDRLLEACKQFNEAIKKMRSSNIDEHLQGIDLLYQIVQPKIQQAIAKAEGKESR